MSRDEATIPIDVGPVEIATERKAPASAQQDVVFDIRDLTVHYGSATAVSGVSFEIYRNLITAMIGPSGCGKSTVIRCLNRMNDLVPSAKIDGQVRYHGQDIYGDGVDPAPRVDVDGLDTLEHVLRARRRRTGDHQRVRRGLHGR